MAETTPVPAVEPPKRYPWYSLNPRSIRKSALMRAVLVGLLLASVSIVPVWRLLWYRHVYALQNFQPVTDIHGRKRQAWRWSTSREIRVYQLPGIRAGQAEVIADGVRALLYDAGLRFTVRVRPLPKPIFDAYRASLTRQKVNGQITTCVRFDELESRLVALRDGDPHADMLVVDAPIAECWWAHGMATFSSGLSLLEADSIDHHLGKHESAHLLGYMYHDTYPLWVLGYRGEGNLMRDTLMMINGSSDTLSPRARDALRAFWRGMERKTGKRYVQ